MSFQTMQKKIGNFELTISTTMLLFTALSLPSLSLAAAGGSARGGGDTCEEQFKIVRADLESWILLGGSKSLTLPAGMTSDQYSKKMLAQLEKVTTPRCVGTGDPGFPVLVSGTPKVCRFDTRNSSSWITCDFNKFNSISVDEQYRLVHHEYAGLAGVEIPNRDDSNYSVSNQLTAYLETQVVRRLAIKPGNHWDPYDLSFLGSDASTSILIDQDPGNYSSSGGLVTRFTIAGLPANGFIGDSSNMYKAPSGRGVSCTYSFGNQWNSGGGLPFNQLKELIKIWNFQVSSSKGDYQITPLDSTYAGVPTAATLTCSGWDLASGGGMTSLTIGDFRAYITALGGTLDTPWAGQSSNK